jgi:hypothetical protein
LVAAADRVIMAEAIAAADDGRAADKKATRATGATRRN